MRKTITTIVALTLTAFASACMLDEPRDVMGNYEVHYVDNLRVYIDDELVAEVVSGDNEEIEWNGETFDITTLCSDEGTDCPAETFWGQVAVDQPWGSEYRLLNFVNLDQEHGEPGQRLGGLLDDDGTFAMLSGVGVGAAATCVAIGVGTVTGKFSGRKNNIVDGIIKYEYVGGCDIGLVTVAANIRLETDFTATRTGDYDVSSVDAEEPINEDGAQVDPDEPEEEHKIE
jgi:hypothetical protein